MAERLSPELLRHLRELELLADADIDTSDIPVDDDWRGAIRGIWNPVEYERRRYDIRGIANLILTRLWDRGIKPTNMALNKLTWFVYEKALAEFHVLISDARVEAWDHGPVFREIYSPSKEYGAEPVEGLLYGFSKADNEMKEVKSDVDTDTSKLIDSVLDEVGSLTPSALRDISHRTNGPWDRVWNSNRKTSAGMVISPYLILATAELRSKDHDH